MSFRSVLGEFVNRPREMHALGMGFFLTYLGLYHAPLVQYAGRNVLTPLAFGIGLAIIGVKPKAVRSFCNNVFLPKDINIPDDIRHEWAYYWTGMFVTYALTHGYNFFY